MPDWPKKVMFASGLRPDWNSGGHAVKETPKKHTHVQISAGGLEDSNIEAVNPFPKDSLKFCTITEDELKRGGQRAKCDPSRRNEVVLISNYLIKFLMLEYSSCLFN